MNAPMPKPTVDELLLDALGRRNLRKYRDKPCANCGGTFRPVRASNRYCSHKCADACRPRREVAGRFWSKVEKRGADECWEWRAARHRGGYGAFDKGYAHRTAWELENGEKIPAGLYVMHSCDNPPCCNPAHLRLGTIADNNRDMSAKGRNHQQRKTHCPRGHEYTPENIARTANGGRQCRACERARSRLRRGVVSVDDLYRDKPDTRESLTFPVFGRGGTVAWFTDYYAAVDFVNGNKRTLFIGEPEYALKHNRRWVA